MNLSENVEKGVNGSHIEYKYLNVLIKSEVTKNLQKFFQPNWNQPISLPKIGTY